MRKVKVPTYSLGEELVNSISHGVGAALAIAAMILCIIKANTAIGVVSSIIYGVLMIFLYIISCIYHALSPNIGGKKVLRVIDHCNILLMVAGTYMPISLSLIGGGFGWLLFGIIWTITAIGVTFNAISVDKFIVVSIACNLLLGWGALIFLKLLLSLCPITGILLLIGGGVAYTIGSVLYAAGKKVPYMHSVFHFFVLLGSILHFFFIYLYCL